MELSSLPFSRDLVLVGGGHTHALVLARWAMKPLPGARVTLVDPAPVAAYSGMLPGFVAGHYRREQLDIDLLRLSRRAGARLVMGRAHGIDRARRRLQVEGHPDISFDVLSLDIGITSRMPGLEGFAQHGVPAKPLADFARAWENYRSGGKAAEVVVLGGGVGGAELAMAMAYALRHLGRDPRVTLIDRSAALSALGRGAAQKLRRHLAAHGVKLVEHREVERVEADRVVLADGTEIPAAFVVGAAGAQAYGWLSKTGLANEAGFIPVDAMLRSRDPRIFAAGDCAEMTDTPRPKAGVFAVRQAPFLFHNLRASLAETGGLKPYRPQKDYLKLISLGMKSAQAERFGKAISGPWLWRWKDHIDRRFMDRFQRPAPRPTLPLPWPRAAGAGEAAGGKPFCGGCGSKIGRAALQDALQVPGIGDDAALLGEGAGAQVISTDHLRAFIDEPVTMTRIAAVHAMGDIWAMGGMPQSALTSIILPRQLPELATRQLREIMEAAQEVFEAAGAEIVGGHSTMGAELSIGFTVTGRCERAPITLFGARPGDRLILTKPLGSGVIMAGDMQGIARGVDVAAALAEMARPQGAAARLLAQAGAMTDVTGFGLMGHLANICAASGVGARVNLCSVPLMGGALALSERGIRSSLYPENRAGFDLPEDPRNALLFDPQTGGGLLAAVPGDAGQLCVSLNAAGFQAVEIGKITDAAGQIAID